MICQEMNEDDQQRYLLKVAMLEFDPFRNAEGDIFIHLMSDVEHDSLRRTPVKINSIAANDALSLALGPVVKGLFPKKAEVDAFCAHLRAIARSRPRREAQIASADLLDHCIVARLIDELVDIDEFEGSATKLKSYLEKLAHTQGCEFELRQKVKSPDSLGKLLKSLAPKLLSLGIKVESATRSDSRKWIITKTTPSDASDTNEVCEVSDANVCTRDVCAGNDTSIDVSTIHEERSPAVDHQ